MISESVYGTSKLLLAGRANEEHVQGPNIKSFTLYNQDVLDNFGLRVVRARSEKSDATASPRPLSIVLPQDCQVSMLLQR